MLAEKPFTSAVCRWKWHRQIVQSITVVYFPSSHCLFFHIKLQTVTQFYCIFKQCLCHVFFKSNDTTENNILTLTNHSLSTFPLNTSLTSRKYKNDFATRVIWKLFMMALYLRRGFNTRLNWISFKWSPSENSETLMPIRHFLVDIDAPIDEH